VRVVKGINWLKLGYQFNALNEPHTRLWPKLVLQSLSNYCRVM